MADHEGTALGRVLRRIGGPAVLDGLVELSGAKLTTLMLEVARRRAGRMSPSDVLRRYREDRFAAPAAVPFTGLRRAEDAALAALPEAFEVVTCSPVAPLGTHSVLATVDQNKVLATFRGSEVAADPTNALALEAAARRRARGNGARRTAAETVRLAAIQRVLRAQRFPAPAQPHFTVLGLVTAGRDAGHLDFERRHLVEHLTVLTDAARTAGPVQVRLTPLDPADLAASVAIPGVETVVDRHRESGRGYYTGLCFKVYVTLGGGWYEVADGGFVDWTQRLLGDRKERLLISGIGIDRLATATLSQP